MDNNSLIRAGIIDIIQMISICGIVSLVTDLGHYINIRHKREVINIHQQYFVSLGTILGASTFFIRKYM